MNGYVKRRLAGLRAGLSGPKTVVEPTKAAEEEQKCLEELPKDGKQRVVVVGLSMVGWKFIDKLVSLDTDGRYEIVSFGEEPHIAYNRLGLTQTERNSCRWERSRLPRYCNLPHVRTFALRCLLLSLQRRDGTLGRS